MQIAELARAGKTRLIFIISFFLSQTILNE